MPATRRCWHVGMTAPPVQRRHPSDATVVEVDGSRFLLEWLDFAVLAAEAVARLREPSPAR
jgi:hypothetical protein